MRTILLAVVVALTSATAHADVTALYIGWNKTERRCNAQGCWVTTRAILSGSGVAVGRVPEGTVVLTAAHVLVDSRDPSSQPPTQVQIWYRSKARYVARVIRVDREADVAVLLVPGAVAVPLVPLAPAPPAPGVRVWIEGYPSATLRTITTVVAPTQSPGLTWYVDGLSEGASGGPVRDERGYLVGLMTLREVGGRASSGPALSRCKQVLQACFGRLPSVESTTVIVNQPPAEPSTPVYVEAPPVVVEQPQQPPATPDYTLALQQQINKLQSDLAALAARGIRVELKDPATGTVNARDFAPGEPIRLQLPSVPPPVPNP